MHVHRSLAIVFLVPALAMMLVLSAAARAQSVPTTTVSGNVYQANGRPASGSLQISWPAFTTAAGQAVAAGRTSVGIGSDGKVVVALAPNIGAMPAGLFYTAVYHLNDGTTSTEYWVVPNTIVATIAQVRSTVMPATQAVQAVNKAYVDQSIAQAVSSQITPTGGTLTGPLYLAGDPTQAAQAANKHYVDLATAQLLPISGGTLSGAVTAPRIGAVLQADQFPGADFGAQLQACVNALDPAYGGTCDARNFPGQVAMAGNLTLAVPNVTIYLPCSTIATAASILVPGGTRNVSLHGCASRGTSAASGAQGGTVLLYSGNSALLQVGDSSFLADTKGFRLDNAALNITAAPAASAQAIAFYRTQEISLASLYLLGNGNQTGLTLDGTGNYSGGTFEDLQFTGFQAAISGIGHTVDNAATTDWLNASTFLRMHIDCPTANGSPVAGTTGIDLQAGDGNTFTGGDVEGCATALHLGAHAVNNTLVGVRNENSTTQIQADAGSSYNNWMTGGTMYTGKLVDNGTRNSFLDTFHRSFNGVNGDWYGSQQDATVTNHYRLGIGTGSERGLQDRYQTDFGYRWTTGLSDASGGIQYYQVLDELNHVYRLSLGQYNNGQGATNNQTVLNAAGTGAVILNGSNNAGTGGVVFGSGGPSSSTVATVDQGGNANFTGTLQVGGVAQSTGTMTVRNNADAEVDYYLWPGVASSQKGSFTYKDFNGSSQWYMVKDQANNWALNSAPGGLDSFKAYQSTNSGDTYINAAKSTGHIRLNYETGAGAETDIYSGSGSSLAAAFLGPTAIKLPGLAAASGKNCIQIDSSGYLSNTAGGCGLAAAVTTAGLAFSDGSVQTTSQQGALTGQANDVTARAAAATAEGDAQSGISNAAAAQTAANQAETDAQAGITNAAAAQASATQAEADAQSGIIAAAAAQGKANAALPANGCATNPSGTLNCTTVAATATLATSAPWTTADSYASSDVTHTGADYGAVITAAANAQSPTGTCQIKATPGAHLLYTPIMIQRSCSLDLTGVQLMPVSGYGQTTCSPGVNSCNGWTPVWGSPAVPIATATLTAGSQTVGVSSTAGLVPYMVVGGVGLPNGDYIVGDQPIVTNTSFVASLPSELVFTGLPANGSAAITSVVNFRGLSTGQLFTVPNTPVGSLPAWYFGTVSLTSVAASSGGVSVYTGTITGGAANAFQNYTFYISGFTNAVNNGTYICTASTSTTLTLVNTAAIAESTASTAYVDSSTISALSASARTVTFASVLTVSSAIHSNSPVAFTSANGTTWTSALTAQQVQPMIMVVPGDQAQPKYEGYRTQAGIKGGRLVDPAFSPTSPGRSISGVQGAQIGGYDRFNLDGLNVEGLTGSALVLGGIDYGTTNLVINGVTYPYSICSSSNAFIGSPRESDYKSLQIWQDGDLFTGQPAILMAGPRCWDTTLVPPASHLQDQPNEISITGSRIGAEWGPALTITSFNTNIWTGIGNAPSAIYFTNDQFEAAGRNTTFTAAPVRQIDIQLAKSVSFTSDRLNVPSYGYCLVCIDKATAVSFANTQWATGGTGDYGTPTQVAITNGGTAVTFLSGTYPSFMTNGEFDDQAVSIVDAGTRYTAYTTLTNAVTGGGTTLNLNAPFAGATCTSGSPCSLVIGIAGYPIEVTNTLGNLSMTGTINDVVGTTSNGILDPGDSLAMQNLWLSGTCAGNNTIDLLSYSNAIFCNFAQNRRVWGTGSQPVGLYLAPKMATGTDIWSTVGQSNTPGNAGWCGFHYVSNNSTSNNGFCSFGSTEISYNFTFNQNGTSFQKALTPQAGVFNNTPGSSIHNGTTAGTYQWAQPELGATNKTLWLTLAGYENTTATAQTITLAVSFGATTAAVVTETGSCAGVTISGATVMLPSSMGSTQTGFCKIEGY